MSRLLFKDIIYLNSIEEPYYLCIIKVDEELDNFIIELVDIEEKVFNA